MTLPINIEDLLSARTVESDRIEFKEGWNPDAIYRSICAFANDFDNIGGGYILVGVAENPLTKTAVRPVKGLSTKQIGDIQQEMIGYNNLLKPYYAPRLFVEEVDGKQIIVLWVIGGSERPYEVPENITAKHKTWKYFIRKYANSIEAKGAEKEELISLANNIPFDDRPNTKARVSDISILRLKDYLIKVKSKLADEVGKRSDDEILSQMELIAGPKEHVFPRNVALMLFTDTPQTYFPYSWVEIIHFPKGAGDKEFTEKKMEGPVQQQITDTLNWIKTSFLQEKVIKISGRAEAARMWNYPYTALEEVVANCLFHRNYQEREPVKIRIEQDAIILYNSGGPDRSIKREDFAWGRVIPKRYRNRRLGDFLKELKLTEGHATGLPALKKAMQQNGSPEPLFDFDEDRTWFQVTLPIHTAFAQQQLLKIDLDGIVWDLPGVNAMLNHLIKHAFESDKAGIAGGIDSVQASAIAGDNAVLPQSIDKQAIAIKDTIDRDIAGGIAGGIASAIANNQANWIELIDSQAIDIVKRLDSKQADTIAGGIAGGVADRGIDGKFIDVLIIAQNAASRTESLARLNLSNRAKNFETYIQPLVALNWLTMTIPTKPTSPKQQYLTTLKGRLILEFLKHKTK